MVDSGFDDAGNEILTWIDGTIFAETVWPNPEASQWALLEPLLLPPGNTGGTDGCGEKRPRRLILDAIFYVVSGGIAWRALPREFPPAMTVYYIFRRWVKNGAWQRIHDALRDQVRLRAVPNATPTAAITDSQSVRGADTV